MKEALAIAVGTVVLLAARMPMAQDAKAPASNMTATASQSAAPVNMGSQIAKMDEHMQMMKALNEKMLSATTPEARKIVMDKQREEMQASMGMMNQMHEGGMMGGMGGGMMAQKGTPPDAAASMPMMQMMQKRMDMMEMMMQTMMDQQGMMAAPKGLDATPRK
ncbi:MAG: hypothetical protein IT478_11675 [Xanthomonadales bacterium]|nr:hypothetical protein [Xanthomonadales bacterium]